MTTTATPTARPIIHTRPKGNASPTTRSADPYRSAILAEAVESPNVRSVSDLHHAPVGSSCTAGQVGEVSAFVKVSTRTWSSKTAGVVDEHELFALGVRRLSLGPVLGRSSTWEPA